jgi:hypothetical protein
MLLLEIVPEMELSRQAVGVSRQMGLSGPASSLSRGAPGSDERSGGLLAAVVFVVEPVVVVEALDRSVVVNERPPDSATVRSGGDGAGEGEIGTTDGAVVVVAEVSANRIAVFCVLDGAHDGAPDGAVVVDGSTNGGPDEADVVVVVEALYRTTTRNA